MTFSTDPHARHQTLMNSLKPKMAYHGGDFESWRKAWRTQLAALLGLDRIMAQPRPPLNVRSVWKRDHELGTIEKIVFTSEADADVPAYVCIPRGFKAPGPFFICLQGHSTGFHNSIAVDLKDDTRTIVVEGDRDFGLVAMRYGVAALCIEQRGFGEREEPYRHTPRCHNPVMHALMLGRTLLGERIYDVDRGIDYLFSRGDVDTSRIGVMGNSGGGTVSMFAGGLLDRLTHVMPSCSFSTFKASIMSIEHCCCNYVPDLLSYAEMAEVVGLAAPKPLVVVSGKDDDIFPLASAQDEFFRVQQIYAAAGAPRNCRHVIGDGGHRFYAADSWPVMLEYLDS